VLSLTLTDALLRISYADGAAIAWYQASNLISSFTKNLRNMRMLGGGFDYPGSNEVAFPDYAGQYPERFTEVLWQTERFGYSWSSRSTTVHIATIVVVLHALSVIVHIGIVTLRRWECTSCSSLIDHVTLAWRSPAPAPVATANGLGGANSMYAVKAKIGESSDGDSAVLVPATSVSTERVGDDLQENKKYQWAQES
jgi:hypothetical protein